MATGDVQNMLARLKAQLPQSWFPDNTPVLDALLSGAAWVLSQGYSLIQYARLQTRINTATDRWLDFISSDFFGGAFPRRKAESDDAFRARIKKEILRPRATRAAINQVLVDLTGKAPIIFEPTNTRDTGGYGFAGMTRGSNLAYGVAGGYGSLSLPFQAMVTAYRPSNNAGVANVGGYYSPNTGANLLANSASFAGLGTTNTYTVGSTDVPTVLPGYSVAKMVRGAGADTASGYYYVTSLTPATTYIMSMYLWIPRSFAGSSVTITSEGSGTPTHYNNVDLTVRDQWQRVIAYDSPSSGNIVAMVLRINAPSGSTLYTTGWRFNAMPSCVGGGYGMGAMEYASTSQISGTISDADIYAAVAKTMPAGTIAWTAINPA